MRIDSATNVSTSPTMGSGRSSTMAPQGSPPAENVLTSGKKGYSSLVGKIARQIDDETDKLVGALEKEYPRGFPNGLSGEVAIARMYEKLQKEDSGQPASDSASSGSFRMSGTEEILKEKRTNTSVNNMSTAIDNLLTSQMEELSAATSGESQDGVIIGSVVDTLLASQPEEVAAPAEGIAIPAHGGSTPDVTVGSSVSHGISMSKQMKSRQAGRQAESSLVSQQMARQAGLIDAAKSESGGTASGAAAYIAGVRSDARVEFEKKRTVYETSAADFEKRDEEREEEIKANTVNGEYIEEGTETDSSETDSSATDSSGEEAVITGPDGSGDTGDSDVDIPTGSGGSGSSGNSGADDVITVKPGNGDDVIIGGASGSADAVITTGGSADAVITTGTTGQGSSAPTLTTTGTATGANNTSSDSSGTVNFKGISIKV